MQIKRVEITRKKTMSEKFNNTNVKDKSLAIMNDKHEVHEISFNIYMTANNKQTVRICSTYIKILVFENNFQISISI